MGKADADLFNNRFPVLAQQLSAEYAQVILGANDKHLKFRSCIAVQQLQTGKWQISLGTRVVYNNRFGRFYMAVIDAVHRLYISPTMLRTAVKHVYTQV
jgi:hypothetical protein